MTIPSSLPTHYARKEENMSSNISFYVDRMCAIKLGLKSLGMLLAFVTAASDFDLR